MKNKTFYNLTPKDSEHPYSVYDAELWNLPNDQFLIMLCILNQKTTPNNPGDSVWVINRANIFSKLSRGGMSQIKFRKAWNELKRKKYIEIKGKKGSYEYIINENPNICNALTNNENSVIYGSTNRNHKIIDNTINQKVNEIPYYERTNYTETEWLQLSFKQQSLVKHNYKIAGIPLPEFMQ